MMRVYFLAILFVSTVTLSACKKEDEGISSTRCKCDVPTTISQIGCIQGKVETEVFDRIEGRTCEESKTNALKICCDGTIRSAWNSSPIFKKVLLASIDTRTEFLVAQLTEKGDPAYLPDKERKELNRLDCVSECSWPDSIYCESIKSSSSNDFRETFNLIHSKLKNNEKSIEKSLFMSGFGIDKDPCDRSNLNVEGNTISNTGQQCIASIEAKLGKDTMLKAEIMIPNALEGSRLMIQDKHPAIDFFASPSRLKLSIDGPLDADYGGHINSVSKVGSDFVVETETGCLKL